MAKFLVRLELKGEKNKDSNIYKKLHEQMSSSGFVTYFTVNSNHVTLPHATYKFVGSKTPEEVRNLAVSAANKALEAARKDLLSGPTAGIKPLVVVVEYEDKTLSYKLD